MKKTIPLFSHKSVTLLFSNVAALALVSLSACAQDINNAPDSFQQTFADLQKNPGDDALREKIIKLALTLNPKPATPDDAITHEGAAEYAFKNAKANSDYSDAAKEYEKALLAAPWVAADYFNCGMAHEKAGENKDAIRNFNLYLLAAPNADDAVDVKKRIGGLQYAQQKIDDQQQQQAQAAQAQRDAEQRAEQAKQATEKAWGGIWRWTQRRQSQHATFQVQGSQITETVYWDENGVDSLGRVLVDAYGRPAAPKGLAQNHRGVLSGRVATFENGLWTFTLSEDLSSITTCYGNPNCGTLTHSDN